MISGLFILLLGGASLFFRKKIVTLRLDLAKELGLKTGEENERLFDLSVLVGSAALIIGGVYLIAEPFVR